MMSPCECGHPNNRHGLGHPCTVPGCPCRYYRGDGSADTGDEAE